MNTQATRILIVEDELPSQRLLKNIIEELRPDWQVVATTTGVEETVEWLQNNPHPQLIFLDVQLSDGLSFEIFDQIKRSEEHTSELQSRPHLVCRLLLEKKNNT